MSFLQSLGRGRGKGKGKNDLLQCLFRSASVSVETRSKVKTRDNHSCLICGHSNILEVAHLIDKAEQLGNSMVLWLMHTGISPAYVRNSPDNLVTLCRGHHFGYDNHHWTLIPSQHDLKNLIVFEKADFEERQRLLSLGRSSARKVPNIMSFSGKCEYLFLRIPSVKTESTNIGPYVEVVSDPLIHYPLEVKYRSRPLEEIQLLEGPSASCVLGVDTGIVFDLTVSGVSGRQLRINPWALLTNAMAALGSPFCTVKTSWMGTEPMGPRVQEAAELIWELRALYDRVLVPSTEDHPSLAADMET